MSAATPVNHPAFSLKREHAIPSLNINVQEFVHNVTGAQHIHMQAESEENVFLVALRTVPEDSRGVAHILEHTALCGSENYPVRDPFFMMTRRSLNTFMNAFTSSDWTAYPIASLNKKDFNNLLDVYLDAVFFSRIDELDFEQEGHRLEFSEPTNPESDLVFKGVVFNEMKGAMSSVSSQLWHTMCKYLFPTSTYHFNSGGEPEDIPDLSYQQLIEFYKTHYHPSNAIFMTYGNIPAVEHQNKFELQVLTKFGNLGKTIAVTNEKRYFSPMRVQEYYANSDDDIDQKSHVVLGWLLGESADLKETLTSQLLSSILLDNSASPLMLALESSDIGNAPSPMCGLDDSQKELSFLCGLADTDENATGSVEELILNTLKDVAKNGVPQEDVGAALHQLELHQREIGGDSYPYGLQLILKSLNSANHRGDPAALLDLDIALEALREEIKSPAFIQNLVQTKLLDNPHRVTLTLVPDRDISARKEAAEKQRLQQIKDNLTEEETQTIIERTEALRLRQEAEDDPGTLPKVTLQDVPEKERSVEPEAGTASATQVCKYISGTNGLIYQQAIYDLPALDNSELGLLSLYSTCVTELGAGDMDYLEMQRYQSAVSGGVSAFQSIRGGVNDINKTSSYFGYSGKSLKRNHHQLSELMASIIGEAQFSEQVRIKEIVSQSRVGIEQSVTGSGHALAMTAAAAGISAPAAMSHQCSGLKAIQQIKALDDSLAEAKHLDELSHNFEQLHKKITSQSSQILLIGEDDALNASSNSIALLSDLAKGNNNASSFAHEKFTPHKTNDAWICNTQVNFCAQAYATVSMGHEDSATLVVLGNYLRNGYLHKVIREQGGAYGGGASQDNNGASFRFYSYRDPRIEGTLNDFQQAVTWLQSSPLDKDKLEEAILGTISSLDRSESPAGQAKRCFYSDLHERDLEARHLFRARVLSTGLDDLIRVSQTYLKPEDAHTAVVTGKANTDIVRGLGLNIIEL